MITSGLYHLLRSWHAALLSITKEMETRWDTLIDGSNVIVSVFLWSVNECLIKKTGIQLSGVLFISNLVSACCCLLYWYIRDPMPGLRLLGDTKRERWALFFFFLNQSTIFSFYYALIRLPLGDLACIGYQAPLWIVLFSWLIFKEALPPWYIYLPAAFLVISGVLLVAQPSFLFQSDAYPLPIDGVIASFMSAARWILMILIVKSSGNTLHSVQYQFIANIACLSISVPVLLMLNSYIFQNEQLGTYDDFLKMPSIHLVVAAYIGLTYFIGMFLNMVAYQRGNVAMIGWLEYFSIPLAFLYQATVFHDDPDKFEGAGASMVMAGCLLPGLHEMVLMVMGKKEETYLSASDMYYVFMLSHSLYIEVVTGFGARNGVDHYHSEYHHERRLIERRYSRRLKPPSSLGAALRSLVEARHHETMGSH